VFVVNNAGASDTTDTISICELRVIAPADTALFNRPNAVPIYLDRSVTGLGIYGWELDLSYDAAKVGVTGVTTTGTVSSVWGAPTWNNPTPGTLIIVHAGTTPLSGGLPLVKVLFRGLTPGIGTTSGLTITTVLFNEGDPCALAQNGSLCVPTGIKNAMTPRAELGQNLPNPFSRSTTIPFALSERGDLYLRIYSPDGALVKTLASGLHDAGIPYFREWDGTNERGESVSSGVYFYRLQVGKTRLTRKMVLLR
jgi:hypothetical protein